MTLTNADTEKINRNGIPIENNFSARLDNLPAETSYYIRAYVKDLTGTIYSNQIIGATLNYTPPMFNTLRVGEVMLNSLNLSVNHTQGNTPTSGYGFVYSTTAQRENLRIGGMGVSTASFIGSPTNNVSFSATLNDLAVSTRYYIRAYAANSAGINYSDQLEANTSDLTAVTLNNFNVNNPELYSLSATVDHIPGNTATTNYGFIYSRTVSGSDLERNTTGVSDNNLTGAPGSSFSSSLMNLTHNTTYYIRAYAINQEGTIYSNVLMRNTMNFTPVIFRDLRANTNNLYSLGISVNYTQGNTPIDGYGFVYSATATGNNLVTGGTGVSAASFTGSPSGESSFSTTLSNLTAETAYNIRAYANNNLGTSYSNQETFSTLSFTPAMLTPVSFSGINTNSFNVTTVHTPGNNSTTRYGFVYSNTTGGDDLIRGNTGVLEMSVEGTPTGSFTQTITGLLSGTNYLVRAFAVNSSGTSYSEERPQRTASLIRFANINASEITETTAILSAIAAGGDPAPTQVGFLYSTTLSGNNLVRGAANVSFIIGSISGQGFVANATALTKFTSYYARAFATNIAGTSYSNSISFTTTAYWRRITPNASWNPRGGMRTYVFSGQLWVVGGVRDAVGFTRYNNVYSSADGINWTLHDNPALSDRTRSMFHNVANFGHTVHNNEMFVVAGTSNRGVFKSSDGANWTQLGNLDVNTRRGNPGNSANEKVESVSFKGSIYTTGGVNESVDTESNIFKSLSGYTWTRTSTAYPNRLGHHASVVFQNKIWVMGGTLGKLSNPSTTFYSDVWNSADGSTWSQVLSTAPWGRRANFEAIVYDNKLWVLGGRRDGDRLNDVWWSEDGRNWNQLPAGPTHWGVREVFGSAVFDGKLFIMGGNHVHGRYNDVWALDLN